MATLKRGKYTFKSYCFDGDFDDYGIEVYEGEELVRDIKTPSITLTGIRALTDLEFEHWVYDNI